MDKIRACVQSQESVKENSDCDHEPSVFDIPDDDFDDECDDVIDDDDVIVNDDAREPSKPRRKSICRSSRKIIPAAFTRHACRHNPLPDRANQTQICVVRESDLVACKHKTKKGLLQHDSDSFRRRSPLVIVKDTTPASAAAAVVAAGAGGGRRRKDINIVLHKNRNVTISSRGSSDIGSKDASVNTINALQKITLPLKQQQEVEEQQPEEQAAESSSTSRVVSQLADLIRSQQQQQKQQQLSNTCFPDHLSEQLQQLSKLALQTQADLQALAQQTQSQLSELVQATAKANAELVAKTNAEIAAKCRLEQELATATAAAAPVTSAPATPPERSRSEQRDFQRSPQRVQSPSGLGERTMSSVLKLLVPIMDIIDTIANEDRRQNRTQEDLYPTIKSRVSFEPIEENTDSTFNSAFRHRDSTDRINIINNNRNKNIEPVLSQYPILAETRNRDCILQQQKKQQNVLNNNSTNNNRNNSDDNFESNTVSPLLAANRDFNLQQNVLNNNSRNNSDNTEPFSEIDNRESEQTLVPKNSRIRLRNNNLKDDSTIHDVIGEKHQACVEIIKSAVEKMKQTLGPSNDEIVHSALQHVFGRENNETSKSTGGNYDLDIDMETDESDDVTEVEDSLGCQHGFRATVKYDNILHHSLIQSDLRRTLRLLNEQKIVRSLDQCLRDLSVSGGSTRNVEQTSSLDDRIPANTVNSAIDGELRPKLGHTTIPGIPSGSADIQRDMLRPQCDRKCRKRDGSAGNK